MRRDGANHHEKLELREFCVRVNLPSPIRQVQVPIWRVITPIQGLRNSIWPVVPLISHISSYPAHHSHLHPHLSLLVYNSTIIAEHNVKSSLSNSPCYEHELTPSTAYTMYNIH